MSVLVITVEELDKRLMSLNDKMDSLSKLFTQSSAISAKAIYSEIEAAKFLSCSTKKLQNLRNNREIGYIRESGGRKVLYRFEHLMEYLASHELKKRK
ncbi:MAG: helix-turn-helix domain-containing protein [Sphingobacteriales bacterium JAD_PAG50586_3]|nr:MAG: helix-turn-helix domain-containing protein [Sphingobacteriales bacterium JAD_PAG50586_3]